MFLEERGLIMPGDAIAPPAYAYHRVPPRCVITAMSAIHSLKLSAGPYPTLFCTCVLEQGFLLPGPMSSVTP